MGEAATETRDAPAEGSILATSAKKRGRPPRQILPVLRSAASYVFSRAKSKRGREDGEEAMLAVVMLGRDFSSWFYDPASTARGVDGAAFKAGILSALGRVGGPDRLLEVARHLATLPPMPVKEAVRIIRDLEGTNRPTPGTVDGVMEALRVTLNAYMAAHPMAREDAAAALRVLSVAVLMQDVDEAARGAA